MGPVWRRLTQFKHLKPITLLEGETLLHIGLTPYSTAYHLSTQQQNGCKFAFCRTNCRFLLRTEWDLYLHWNHRVFVFCCQKILPRVSFCLLFSTLGQMVSVSLVKSAKLESQPAAGHVKSNKNVKWKQCGIKIFHLHQPLPRVSSRSDQPDSRVCLQFSQIGAYCNTPGIPAPAPPLDLWWIKVKARQLREGCTTTN